MRGLMLKVIDSQVKRAVGVITSTIDKLEKANKKYEELDAKIEVDIYDKNQEIRELRGHQTVISNSMYDNQVMIDNFKGLLGGGR